MISHRTRPRGLLRLLLCLLGLLAGVAAAAPVVRDLPPGLQIPAAAQPGPGFEVDQATEAYLNLLSPAQRELSDRYFEGGYWLQLWQLLWTLAACAVLLFSGVSRRLNDLAQRISRRRWLSTSIYGAAFVALLFLLQFPLTVYSDYLRERAYALSEQPFAGWLRDELVNDAVTLVLGTAIITVLYAAVRRSGRFWWAWASGLCFVFLMFVSWILPPLIEPLFNDFKPLPAGPVREAVLALARANQVPTDHVEWFDASRQTTRLSAHVSGFLGTTRIALNDNLVGKSSLPEIRAVLGHELGHYVLNHVWKEPILLSLVAGMSFMLLHFAMDAALARWGRRLGLQDRADPAALPLAVALIALISFLFTPLQNSIVRSYEAEADAFGLNAAREPQAWAMAAMRLSTYRKLRPGGFEEFVFYDHPSGYERVHAAMVWLKENPAAARTVPAAPSP
jgi:STE24 endopeptidase